MSKKKVYIVVDTWNGSGYSSENGMEIEFFKDFGEAKRHCKEKALHAVSGEHKFIDALAGCNGIFYGYSYDIDEDNGTYQILEVTEDSYGVEILTNINAARVLNREDYDREIHEREDEIALYVKDSLINSGEFDSVREGFEQMTDIDTDGSFYSATDDVDYQYKFIDAEKLKALFAVKMVEVLESKCYNCSEEYEYTEIFSMCPHCLTDN